MSIWEVYIKNMDKTKSMSKTVKNLFYLRMMNEPSKFHIMKSHLTYSEIGCMKS